MMPTSQGNARRSGAGAESGAAGPGRTGRGCRRPAAPGRRARRQADSAIQKYRTRAEGYKK